AAERQLCSIRGGRYPAARRPDFARQTRASAAARANQGTRRNRAVHQLGSGSHMKAARATDAPIVAIVQARMGSTRLPGKVMKMIAGAPAIGHVLGRVRRATLVDEVWLACADIAADDPLAGFAEGEGFPVFRGSESDVLARFAAVARRTDARAIVRITGDCPMIDPAVIDLVVERWKMGGADFVSNTLQRSFPDGLDVEIFSRAALDRADSEAAHPFLREHVTPYIHGRL